MLDHRACWEGTEKVAAFPVVPWPDGLGTKAAAAIRADIVEDAFDAVTAESAFKRTEPCVSGI